MKKILIPSFFIFAASLSFGQGVGINNNGANPANSAMLDVVATDKGILVPRVALTATNAAGPITAPATSLLVYNTATAGAAPNNVTPGFYYWNGAAWQRFDTDNNTGDWKILGNANTTAGTNFIGTTNAQHLDFRTNNVNRMRIMSNAYPVIGIGTAFPVANLSGNSAVLHVHDGGTSVGSQLVLSTHSTANNSRVGIVNFASTQTTNNRIVASVESNLTAASGTNASGDLRFYTNNANNLTERFRIPNANQVHAMANGTAALPFYSWANDANTGMSSFAGDQLNWSTNGVERLRLTNTQLATTFNGSAGTPAYSFTTDTDIGMYRIAANTLGFSTSGTERLRLGATEVVFNELGNNYNFRVESQTNANTINVNAATNQIGFFIPNSPFAPIKLEANFNDNDFPWVRMINTSAGAGTALIAVGQNAATGGSWIPGVGMSGTTNNVYGISGHALTTTVSAFGGYFVNDGAFATVGGWQAGPWVMRKIVGNGTVNTIVDGLNDEKVVMTCPEAPEIVFQDFGIGKLSNGYCKVEIDPIFSKNIIVDENHPLKVYIQLEGDCNGVYVFNKSDSSFEVKELNNGTSNAKFSWMIVANRANVEVQYSDGSTKISHNADARFTPAPEYKQPKSLNGEERLMIGYKSIKK